MKEQLLCKNCDLELCFYLLLQFLFLQKQWLDTPEIARQEQFTPIMNARKTQINQAMGPRSPD